MRPTENVLEDSWQEQTKIQPPVGGMVGGDQKISVEKTISPMAPVAGAPKTTGGPSEMPSIEKPLAIAGAPRMTGGPSEQATLNSGNGGEPGKTGPLEVNGGPQIGDRGTGTPASTINTPAINVNLGGGGGMITGAGNVQQATAAPGVTPETATTQTYNANTATGAPGVTAGTAGAGTATGTQATINESTDLVENRANDIINSNSKLMQAAIRRANQRSSGRGMINGSAGIAAAEGELYNAAIPIATADAAAYNAQRLENQRATNTASITNAQLFTDVSKFNVEAALKAGIVNQEQANAIAQFNATQTNDASRFNAASANEMSRFNIDNLLKAGIINQQQANDMAKFNAGELNAQIRQDSANNTSLANAQIGANAQLGAAQLSSQTQLSVAQLNAETAKLNNEANNNQSKYNSDQSYKSQIDSQRYSLVNNILQNPDMDPAYKQQLIRSMGPDWEAFATATVMSIGEELNPNSNDNTTPGNTAPGGIPKLLKPNEFDEGARL